VLSMMQFSGLTSVRRSGSYSLTVNDMWSVDYCGLAIPILFDFKKGLISTGSLELTMH
jgi:hypothetical protein